jgi:hypothetical protein
VQASEGHAHRIGDRQRLDAGANPFTERADLRTDDELVAALQVLLFDELLDQVA